MNIVKNNHRRLGHWFSTSSHFWAVVTVAGCLLGFPAAKMIAAETLAAANGDIVIHPIQHASMVLQWNGQSIYVDPVGGGGKYAAYPKADWILITHATKSMWRC